jgi:hypothetical protein
MTVIIGYIKKRKANKTYFTLSLTFAAVPRKTHILCQVCTWLL